MQVYKWLTQESKHNAKSQHQETITAMYQNNNMNVPATLTACVLDMEYTKEPHHHMIQMYGLSYTLHTCSMLRTNQQQEKNQILQQKITSSVHSDSLFPELFPPTTNQLQDQVHALCQRGGGGNIMKKAKPQVELVDEAKIQHGQSNIHVDVYITSNNNDSTMICCCILFYLTQHNRHSTWEVFIQ